MSNQTRQEQEMEVGIFASWDQYKSKESERVQIVNREDKVKSEEMQIRELTNAIIKGLDMSKVEITSDQTTKAIDKAMRSAKTFRDDVIKAIHMTHAEIERIRAVPEPEPVVIEVQPENNEEIDKIKTQLETLTLLFTSKMQEMGDRMEQLASVKEAEKDGDSSQEDPKDKGKNQAS